jgi:hypothetical protein
MRLSSNDGSTLSGYPQILDRIEAQGFEAAPVVRTELLLRNDRAAVPAICFGIDPTRQRDVSTVLHTALGEEGSSPAASMHQASILQESPWVQVWLRPWECILMMKSN